MLRDQLLLCTVIIDSEGDRDDISTLCESLCSQHFTSIDDIAESDVTNYAGAVILADYCPYVQVCARFFLIFLFCVRFLSHLVYQSQ